MSIQALLTHLFCFAGPRGIPYFGNVFQLTATNGISVIENWRKQFGDIFQIHLVGKNVTLVSGENELREMLIAKSNDFAGRPHMFRCMQFLNCAGDVIISDYSPKWIMMKKAFINTLKMYGERMSFLEDITRDAVHVLVERFEKTHGQPINIKNDVHHTVTDIMASIVCSGPYSIFKFL